MSLGPRNQPSMPQNRSQDEAVRSEGSSAIAGCSNIARHLLRQSHQQPEGLAVAVANARGQGRERNVEARHYCELSFLELNQLSDRYAHALKAAGIRRGMRTAVMVTPSPEFFGLSFALFKVGAVLVFVDPGMGLSRLKTCLAEAAPEAFIGIRKAHIARTLFGWAKSSLRILLNVGGGGPFCGVNLDKSAQQSSTEAFELDSFDADEDAAILYTSGSTGIPKGARYTHGMFAAQVEAIRRNYGIEPGEVDLATFPLFALFGPALGMASVIPDMDASRPGRSVPANLANAIHDYRCTNAFASPALITKLAEHADSSGQGYGSLRRIISAGAPAKNSDLERLQPFLPTGVDVWSSYGATECMPISKFASSEILATTRRYTDRGAGACVGVPMDGVEIRVIRISDEAISTWRDDLELGVGDIGEIVVRSATASPNYVERPEQTEQAKISCGSGFRDFWHRMGDVGYVDPQGRVWMCGRKSHRVECESGCLYTVPCEAPFNTHAQVNRSALVGVRQAGKTVPVMCIETIEGVRGSPTLTAELRDIGQRYPHTADIEIFMYHPKFPVDVRHNAKIFREKLRVWAQGRLR